MTPQRPVLSLLLALAMIGAGGTASALASPGEAADRTPETPIQDQTQTGDGSASNASNATAGTIFTPQQSYGATVTVDVEEFSTGGFVVIRRENNDSAPIIGVSRYLAPGSYEDVRIRLFEVPGRNFSQSRLEEDQELIAMLHRDSDGDRQFDFVRTDEPLTQNGSVVQNPANVTVIGTAALARTQPTADLSFTAQSAPNGTVTVRSANLSTGGFVVIHRGDGVSGPIIGVSRRLAPGSHEDVQVELFNVSGQEFSRTDLGRSQVLTATAYLDTNNNSRFDYVRTNGSTDFPYLRTGSVVTNPSTINVTNSTTVSS